MGFGFPGDLPLSVRVLFAYINGMFAFWLIFTLRAKLPVYYNRPCLRVCLWIRLTAASAHCLRRLRAFFFIFFCRGILTQRFTHTPVVRRHQIRGFPVSSFSYLHYNVGFHPFWAVVNKSNAG